MHFKGILIRMQTLNVSACLPLNENDVTNYKKIKACRQNS